MVTGAPRSTLVEQDDTQIWTEQSGLGVYIGLPAKAGRLEPFYTPDLPTLLNEYTVNGKIEPDDDIAFQVAKRIVQAPGLGLIVNRVTSSDALYGGCTIPCGTSVSAKPLSIGLANPEDITFTTGSVSLAEQIQLQFRADVNGNTGGTAFYLPAQKYIISFTIAATAEQDTYTINNPDVNGSLAGKFITLPGGLGYVWYRVDASGTDPGLNTKSLEGLTGYAAAISTNATQSAIATATATALSEAIGLTAVATDASVAITLTSTGVASPGSSGSAGFTFTRTVIGYNEIEPYASTMATVKPVTITRNITAEDLATAVYNILTTDTDLAAAFTTTLSNQNTLTITYVTAGPVSNARLVSEAPAPIVLSILQQGSNTSGSDTMFLYFNNPSVKANSYGIKVFNSEDYPDKAPETGTFLIEVYTKSNTRKPISTAICTREQARLDSYGNSMYVQDVLARLTDIRAIDNTDVPSNELPRSVTDILWFDGGSSGSKPTLMDYIDAVQPIANRERYSVSLLLPAGYYANAYLQELDRIAQKRGEAVALTGVPLEYETSVNYLTKITNWLNNEVLLTSSYSGVFSPAAKVYDSSTGRNIILPIETCIAEQIAFTNENYSISQPILGFARGTLQSISGLVRYYNFADDGTADGDILYDNRINCIRHFNTEGYVIWGQKTTQRTTSARDRLNVRLMLTALKPRINNVQLGLVGDLPTPTTKKRALGLLTQIFDRGVSKNWFKEDYTIDIAEDPTLEAQHIYRIDYQVKPWYSIEYVQGYLKLVNDLVTEIVVY